MNKLDLIDALKNEAKITKREAAAVVKLFFKNMADALASGDRVEIRGLCSFYVKNYKGYTGRNPIYDGNQPALVGIDSQHQVVPTRFRIS